MNHFFVTGTDTDVGKTFVSVALLEAAKNKSLTTAALKPIAAGCHYRVNEAGDKVLVNDDALALQEVITASLPYSSINPITLEPAIAPHIAASQTRLELNTHMLKAACLPVLELGHHFVLVEGAGGWRVPLNRDETLADFAKLLDIPVILVVGIRLGCINHALLSAEAIIRDGLKIAAWVANQIDGEMPVAEENIETLKGIFEFPLLGHIPFLSKSSKIDASGFLDIDKLLEN